MEHTRVEILKNGVWTKLRLRESGTIRYNVLINRIGDISAREISHSNTFSLPPVFQNTDALGLNVFNKKDLAKAMNRKFEAKYYVKDKLLQIGFLLINNTNGGTIQVNFIDQGLELVGKWGTTTFNQLVLATGDNKPSDYVAAITELNDYTLTRNSINVDTSNIGSRGYRLALFPNNLNTIGDLFQKDDADGRVVNTFNPFQSRPIYNAKAIMDLACESYGYATEFDSSINIAKLQKLWIVDSKLNESQRDDGEVETKISTPTDGDFTNEMVIGTNPLRYRVQAVFNYGFNESSKKPNDVPGFVNPADFSGTIFWYRYSIWMPEISESYEGTVHITATIEQEAIITPLTHYFNIKTVWQNTAGDGTIWVDIPPIINLSGGIFPHFDVTWNKSQFNVTPAGTNGVMIGIMIFVENEGVVDPTSLLVKDLTVTETFIPSGVISYDEFGQYEVLSNKLTHAAPHETMKKLMSSIMQQQGILMNINGIAKTVKFFTYGHYQAQVTAGNTVNWSNYLRKYNNFLYNTDYGSNYAKVNGISLSTPYIGNVFNLLLSNQGEDSKYKDSGTSIVESLIDVTAVKKISGTTEFFEYTNEGIGMVEEGVPVTTLIQTMADRTTQGSIPSLPSLQNVNYSDVPNGVKEWFKLIDNAVRTKANFLLPISEVRDLDISKPVFINDLGGYWIVEEISQYVDAQTEVQVKLIKLIDDLSSS